MSAWDKAKETADKLGTGGKYLRLKNDKDKAIVIFCGEPEAREVVWDNEKKTYLDPESKEGKALIAADPKKNKPGAKFSINVFNVGDKAMQVWEMSIGSFKDLLKAREKYTLDKNMFEVERSGKANDPKTSYSILVDKEIPKDVRVEMEKCGLHDLKNLDDEEEKEGFTNYGSGAAGANGKSTASADGEKPIDGAAKDKLMARLKPLPRDKIDAFTTKFGIAKIKDLKRKDLAAAEAYVDELEGKKAEPAPVDDPFG